MNTKLQNERVLEHQDYLEIVFDAMHWRTVQEIKNYFKGKEAEHQKCNPQELFIAGIDKAIEDFIEAKESKKRRIKAHSMDAYNNVIWDKADFFLDGYPGRKFTQKKIETVKKAWIFHKSDKSSQEHEEIKQRLIEARKQTELASADQSSATKNQKTFPEMLKHDRADELAEKLKEEFNGKKKHLRFMIEALSKHEFWGESMHEHGAQKAITKALADHFGYEINRQNLFQENREWEWDNLECADNKNSKNFKEIEEKVLKIIKNL